MYSQQQTDFDRISEAIDFIKNNFTAQPSLDEIANHVHLSASHFQKMFTEWAGVSPKKFLQYISINYAKAKLRNEQASLFDTALETGLSGTGRLHDLFINIEGMTPGEYKNGGENLIITYNYAESVFGKILIAKTKKGICYIAFYEDEAIAFLLLKNNFPKAIFTKEKNVDQKDILNILTNEYDSIHKIKLHLKGTDFQLKVWETLLTIPSGALATYGDIAKQIENPKASRAVGSAIGSNPVAYLIPCHRVIQASGIFGGYMWGPKRKTAIIAWEAAQLEK
jgi:AraC family transcriptional regulator, regulatory protein of adaptative response / methylated-DNA-[protein]-cysteine methyltransferase